MSKQTYRTNEQWTELFNTYEQSGLTLAEFCQENKLSHAYFIGKNIICDYLKITEDQWASYHATMIQTRNCNLAHFDHQSQGQDILIDETSGNLLLKRLEQQISEVCT